MNRKPYLPLILAALLLALCLPAALVGAQAATPAVETGQTLTGTLNVINGDPQDPAGQPIELYFLADGAGGFTPLLIDDAGRATIIVQHLNGQAIIVVGRPATTGPAPATVSDGAVPFEVESIRPASDAQAGAAAVTGNTKWLSIACKFADIADEPRSLSYFQNMYANAYPGLDHYWREASYEAINLVGSAALGWYTLPQPMSFYQIDNEHIKWTELFLDCAAQADPYVNFADFKGVNLMLNSMPGCCAWGGNRTVTLDGVTKTWSVTWLPPFSYTDQAYIQHEMTHAYGILWHSYAGTNAYGDPWDVVSNAFGGSHCDEHAVYGRIGQHTIAYHRDYLGWLPAARTITVGPETTTITLDRATQPGPDGYLMVNVPINGSTGHYYSLEARQLIGYDSCLKGNSVTIHEIGGAPQRVQLMDPYTGETWGNKVWEPGETWVAPQGGIMVHIDAATATGFTVTITSGLPVQTVVLNPTADTYVDHETPDANYGTSPILRTRGAFWDSNELGKATFLRFDPDQLPPLVAQARLRLTAVGGISGHLPRVQPYWSTYSGSTTMWIETGLTWNNIEKDDSFTPYVYWPTGQGSNWLEWDIAGVLYVRGATALNSLMVDNGVFTFSSKEGGNPPQLIVDYLVPPDETTTTTFLPTNDAYVSQAKPKNVFGGKTALQVKNAAKDADSYLKFNVRNLPGAVQSATLRLYVTDPGPDGGSVYAVSPYYKNTTTLWLETGLNWNNAPPIAGAPAAALGKATKGKWIEVDVTGAVIAGVAADNGRVSFALRNNSTNLVVYSSKEGAHPPELVVVTSP